MRIMRARKADSFTNLLGRELQLESRYWISHELAIALCLSKKSSLHFWFHFKMFFRMV